MTRNQIFITIQNHTKQQMATNVFNAEHYDWAKGTRPDTKLHERVICAHTEIAEMSQIISPAISSYQLGLTISDGSYLELKIKHGLQKVDVNDVTSPSAQEMCEVSGSVSKYRVERSIFGVEPWLLNISIFEADGDTSSQYSQQGVVSQTPTRTQSTTDQEIFDQSPTDTQIIQQEIFDKNPTDTQIIQQELFDQNPTDPQIIQQEVFDQNPTDTQIIQQENPTDTQLVQQEILGQGLNDDQLYVEEDIFSNIANCTELFIKREILQICLNYAPTLILYGDIDQVSESLQQTTL